MTIAKQWVKQWARKLQLAFLALAGALVLTACASPQPADYAQEKPVLDLKEYFNGTIDAWGVFQDRSGKVVKRFTVVMKCTWDGNTGVLDEDFTYSDGTTQKRVWTLKKDGNKYTGTAGDVLGQANGETSGNAFQWKYTMLLPVDGTTYEVQFDDWMYQMDDKVMLNRATMSKFGIELGEVLLSFRKRD
ncbi:DUF3833 domain-containing protein [Limnobacter profundi]|jgi:hypothetical protein|uniref:DUF3833 domain-containing protein n=1 Tax=Limnobacter profundi TaxID=2732163 RepID=A0ABX6N440_9BURK|nr:DUF3833 domain-containing protein [Limnobacter sp. SAORIC-580]MDZ4049464.1 DUF3833 domain-containing protein [Limnobacter sp.]QJR28821.1 DUF3833 domain-containing protein [Limnobacter sp. SAORIC-580]